MEPSLNDMDDYNKPLKPNKRKLILIALGIGVVLYFGYVLLMTSL